MIGDNPKQGLWPAAVAGRGGGSRAPYAPRDLVALALLSIGVALVGVVGYAYVSSEGYPTDPQAQLAALTLLGAIVFALVAIGVDHAYGRLAGARAPREADVAPACRSAWEKGGWVAARLAPRWSAKGIAASSAVMLLLWSPWLVASFPGVTDFDLYYQIYQCYPEAHPLSVILTGFFDDAPIDAYFLDHHPLFDTLLFGAFGFASDSLTGSWNAGVFAYVLLQSVATAGALTASLAYLRHRGCPAGIALVGYAFFCLAPFVPASAFDMGKDSLFSLVYLPYFVLLFELVRTKGACFGSRRVVVSFVLLGVLLCLTKKTGLYVVVPTALVALACFRAWWKPLLAQVLACALTMLVILPHLVFPLLNVAPGGKQEALGILLQQTAAYAQRHPSLYTPEERAAIDAVVDYQALRQVYTFGFHDYPKWLFNQEATDEQLLAYLKAWATCGMRDPETYLSALMGVAGRYVAPCATLNLDLGGTDRYFNDTARYFSGDQELGRPMVVYPAELAPLRDAMGEAYGAACESPVLRWPFEAVVYVLWLPAILLFVALRRRLGALTLFAPGAMVLLFCLIGPVFDMRYCLPLLYTAPLLAGALACLVRQLRQPPCFPGPWWPARLGPLGGPSVSDQANPTT